MVIRSEVREIPYGQIYVSLSDGSTEELRKMLDLNVLGLSVCTKEALQSMKERGVDDGHIIHINRSVISVTWKSRYTQNLKKLSHVKHKKTQRLLKNYKQ
jgi:NADP-dependent 3-hydroxy acid dehydrogenase YdfG